MLLILLALDAGRVVPIYSLIERLWEDEPPANAGNSLQSLVSRLRSALREAGPGDQVIESHPAGYRLALAPDEVDAVAFEALARQGSPYIAVFQALLSIAGATPVDVASVLRQEPKTENLDREWAEQPAFAERAGPDGVPGYAPDGRVR